MSQVEDRIYTLREENKMLRQRNITWRNDYATLAEEKASIERQRIALKLALRRIAESLVTWKDEERDYLLESAGNIANAAIRRDEEGMQR